MNTRLQTLLSREPVFTGLDIDALAVRSLVSSGVTARLARVLARAQRGERIVIGAIGGSITQGANASSPESCFASHVADWWRTTFPGAQVDFINAGIGATGSDYGALRAWRDLLMRKPDFVVVDYGVNDGETPLAAESLEGLLRQILRAERQPAVLLMFMMWKEGRNSQANQIPLGLHYGLPMISFRDALWPAIQSGPLKWGDIIADDVHPNDSGHALAARLVTTCLDRILESGVIDVSEPDPVPLPPPLYSDRFERVTVFEANEMKPIRSEGFVFENNTWCAEQPGSVFETELSGEILYLMYFRLCGPMGRAQVQVDEQPPVICEGWFAETWGGYRVLEVMADRLPPGSHRVRVTLLDGKHPQSTGTRFQLLGMGSAGVRHEGH